MRSGDKIGRYVIVSKIGAGGMGEVYLAEDAKLGRRVAVKILPPNVAGDTERIRRFEHEAKSASALNHPNIITIYEINDEGDSLFIAMEFVEGQTLASRIRARNLNLSAFFDIAIQTAGALAAAHDANVIHRDIKPDNVIIRPDGLVKVLDFGLAKLTDPSGELDLEARTMAIAETSPGLVVGTVGYMSPEQARGKKVDARSDIFSFGAMLYEMLSGKRPFVGENDLDVVASIIHQEPVPLSRAAPDVPHDLETLVRKTLRKNRDERYQTVKELLADLKDLRFELGLEVRSEPGRLYTDGFGEAKTTAHTFGHNLSTTRKSAFNTHSIRQSLVGGVKLHPIWAILALTAAAVVFAAAGTGLYKLNDWSNRPESFQAMRLEKLTSSGNVFGEHAAVSPDGKYVVFVVQEAGRQSLWVKRSATASNVQIVPPAEVRFSGVTFSRDADYVYYTAETPGSAVTYQVPVLGGVARKLLADANGPIAFSPDGSRITFIRGETQLMIANSDGSEPQTLAAGSNGSKWLHSSWSPDGKIIAGTVYSPTDDKCHIVEIRVEDGSERIISTTPWLRISGLAWLQDSSGLMISGRDPETQLSQIWFIAYPDGTPRRITNDLSNYFGVSLAADGQTLVSTQLNRLSNIWATRDPGIPQKLTSDLGKDEGMSGAALSPDGRIVYTSREKGIVDLWIVNPDGSDKRQLTFKSESNFSPAVSPDGRFIVFVSTRGGNANIWRMGIDGANPVQIAGGPDIEGEPNFSPDGKWVVFDVNDLENKTTIWKVGIDGGSPVKLTDVESGRPVVSPDGQFIACDYGEGSPGSPSKLAVIPFDGGPPVRILDLPPVLKSRIFRWADDGKAINYIDSRDRIDNIWSQSLDSTPPKQLTDFKSERIFRFDGPRFGKGLTMARGNENSDVVMISGFR